MAGPARGRRPEIVSPARTFPQSISAHTSARDALARMTRQVYAGLVTAPGRSVRSALLVSVALLLLAPGPATARTRCSYEAAAKKLTVRADREAYAEVIRRGQEIVVRGLAGAPVACHGGVPTVLNSDSIRIVTRGDFDFVDLLLAGGPFAPGASPEPTGAPEIEVHYGGYDPLGTVVGTAGADHFRWGPGGGKPGLNLNPDADTDVDVTVKGGGFLDIGFLIADGGDGDDRISSAPNPVGEEVWAEGGDGNDLLEAHPLSGGVLEGRSRPRHVARRPGRRRTAGRPRLRSPAGRPRPRPAERRLRPRPDPGRSRLRPRAGARRVARHGGLRAGLRPRPGRPQRPPQPLRAGPPIASAGRPRLGPPRDTSARRRQLLSLASRERFAPDNAALEGPRAKCHKVVTKSLVHVPFVAPGGDTERAPPPSLPGRPP